MAENILMTYGDASARESVISLIEILSAQETQISSMIVIDRNQAGTQ